MIIGFEEIRTEEGATLFSFGAAGNADESSFVGPETTATIVRGHTFFTNGQWPETEHYITVTMTPGTCLCLEVKSQNLPGIYKYTWTGTEIIEQSPRTALAQTATPASQASWWVILLSGLQLKAANAWAWVNQKSPGYVVLVESLVPAR